MRYHILLMALLLLVGGCSDGVPDGQSDSGHADSNFIVLFECASGGNLSMNVTGNAFVNMHDFMRSNCSLYFNSDDVIRVRCPKEPLEMSPLARRGQELLNKTAWS